MVDDAMDDTACNGVTAGATMMAMQTMTMNDAVLMDGVNNINWCIAYLIVTALKTNLQNNF